MDQKITLYTIFSSKKQTYRLLSELKEVKEVEEKGYKFQCRNLLRHILILDYFFDLQNFFEFRNDDMQKGNSAVYHIPFSYKKEDRDIEIRLKELKGKMPIIARVYDAHSPYTMSTSYLDTHHDLVLTYNKIQLSNSKFVESKLTYDHHLISLYNNKHNKNHTACMILGNKYSKSRIKEGYSMLEELNKKNITNQYPVREEVASIEEIDVYGFGWNNDMVNYKGSISPHDAKYKILENYQFSYVLENVNLDSYISEKVLDCILTLTIPIYLGTDQLSDYIPEKYFISLNKFNSAKTSFEYISNIPQDEIAQILSSLEEDRLGIFEKFSTFKNTITPVFLYLKGDTVSSNILQKKYARLKSYYDSLVIAPESMFKAKDHSILHKVKSRIKKYL